MTVALDDLELPEIDPSGLTPARFHQTLAGAARSHWLGRSPLGIVVFDRDAGLEMLRDRRLSFPSVELVELQGIMSGPIHDSIADGLLARNGEDHARLRRLITAAFAPSAVRHLQESVRTHMARLWESLSGATRCDFVTAFARPLPAMLIADLLGVPDEHERMARYSEEFQGPFKDDLAASRAALEAAYVEAYEWIAALAAARRRRPGDDFVSRLVGLTGSLSEAECVSVVASVISGGTDTTTAQMAHGLRLFCEHPAEWERLAADPSLAPGAANEVIRFEPITPFTARLARSPVVYRDVEFPSGTVIFVCAATANRSPEVFDDPHVFDITAPRSPGAVLTFGNGPHVCPGAGLARMELAEAYAFLAPRMPGLALDGYPRIGPPLGIYEVGALPVRWAAP